MFDGSRALRLVRRMSRFQQGRGDTSRDWKAVDAAMVELDNNPVIELATEWEIERSAHDAKVDNALKPAFLVGCVDDNGCDCSENILVGVAAALCAAAEPDGIGANDVLARSGVSGELGDGKILDVIQKFLNWLLSEDTLNALVKFITTLVTLFMGFFA